MRIERHSLFKNKQVGVIILQGRVLFSFRRSNPESLVMAVSAS